MSSAAESRESKTSVAITTYRPKLSMNLSSLDINKVLHHPLENLGSNVSDGSVICAADRGAERKWQRSGLVEGNQDDECAPFSIDWLQLTFPEDNLARVKGLVRSISDLSFIETTVPAEQAYSKAEQSGAFRLYSCNQYGFKSICLVLAGALDTSDQVRLLSEGLAMGGEVTRIDFAFDDIAGITNIPFIVEAWIDQNVCTCYRQMQLITSFGRSPTERKSTVLIGSRTSDTCVRIYEKWNENELKFNTGGENNTSNDNSPSKFLRWELEVKHDTAHKAVISALEGPVDRGDDDNASPGNACFEQIRTVAIKLLTSRLSFRCRSSSSNISRAPELFWWRDFIEYLDPAPALKERPTHRTQSVQCRTGFPMPPQGYGTAISTVSKSLFLNAAGLRKGWASQAELQASTNLAPRFHEPSTVTSALHRCSQSVGQDIRPVLRAIARLIVKLGRLLTKGTGQLGPYFSRKH